MALSGAQRSKQYNERHPDRVAAYRSRPEVKEAMRRRSAAYYERNKERVAAYVQRPEIRARRADLRRRPEQKRIDRERMRRYTSKPESKRLRRAYRLRVHYGVTLDWYESRLAVGCEICQRPFTAERKAEVDHDRACCPGKVSCRRCVRGLVCGPCNRDGMVGLDYLLRVGSLERAIAYAQRRIVD